MKTTMYAIIKKDFRGLAANRRLFIALLIVPLILTIVLPSIFLMTCSPKHPAWTVWSLRSPA